MTDDNGVDTLFDLEDDVAEGIDVDPADDSEALAEDEIVDYITDLRIKERGNEGVRQRIARALFLEYGISVDDMERDFPIPVSADGRRRSTKRADIAVFKPGSTHSLENLERVVVCKPEPKGGRAVTKIRTFTQAQKDLDELQDLLGQPQTPNAQFGMWTNGLDFFFLHRESTNFGVKFDPRADWPLSHDSLSGTFGSAVRLRRGEAAMLKTAFRRCHNFVHGNEGLPKDAAFWQFLYVIFAKVYDELESRRLGIPRRFYALPNEPFDDAGREAISDRVKALFADVKKKYKNFTERDEITMSNRALAFIVGELSSYDLAATDIDVKGIAYQELVGINLRGDRGQYFTPRGAVELMVEILDPQENDVVFDPACGTGGFLRETLRHLLKKWQAEEGTTGLPDTEEQLETHRERLAAYVENHLYGADFDPFLVRATSMSVMLLTGVTGNVFYMDSLAFPHGHLSGVAEARTRLPLAPIGDPTARPVVDILMTNPPFGTDIKIEDQDVLNHYRDGVAQPWSRNKETGAVEATPGGRVSAMSPEQLFIQRAVEWVKPSGKLGIVLPNGILSNPGPSDEGIRRWILDNCWVLASIELPVETFVHDANVNILTSLLFLKRKTDRERRAANLGQQLDYPVFMAVAEKVGFDRRGNPVYKRRPDGEVITEPREYVENVRRNGVQTVRRITRREKAIDNDLPVIAERYREFRKQHPEPGETR
ncbi:methylation-associated defense system DNA methyltransferase MAD2 [Actinoplanes derwentensis]|uniref:Type I restriction enzyme M protein n=2 Tax=Actinoplanes derwentensis TaxID=113562 RepID=A0A1H2BSQ3_9ACTN|nr:N-6 DNA methylase [Actinoplanes derwentensis]GID83031.1 restriction endonuclease subunit M [Actinoplanes derwentensis]SDT60949.1 type I restriction enzyme M protein [Actinoplanes derwentensis]